MQVIGIIGTGEMGWRMGKLLAAAGYSIVCHDIRAEALERPRQSGFQIAVSVAELCSVSDIVITCVTDGESLRDVVGGAGGIAAALDAGKPVIDTTSAEPWISEQLADALRMRGIPFLDAPVSGGVPAAEAGRMNFMVGGDPDLLERCRPVLSYLGPVIKYVGSSGSGHAIKAVNMLALAASMLSACEVVALGLVRGETLDRLIAILDAGLGASFCTRVHFPRFIVPGSFSSGFTFDLMLKDLSIGIGLAERRNVPLFLQRAAFEHYRVAANTGLRGKDNTRIAEPFVAFSAGQAGGAGLSQGGSDLELIAVACNLVVAAEALSLGESAGLAPETIIDVLGAGSGDSAVLSRALPAYIAGEMNGFPRLCDIQAAFGALAEANVAAVPVPLIAQAAAIYACAIRKCGPDTDARQVIHLIAEWTGQPKLSRCARTVR